MEAGRLLSVMVGSQMQVYYKFPFDFRTGAGQGSAIVNLDVVFSIRAASLSQLLSINYSRVPINASYHDPSHQNLYAPSDRLRQASMFKVVGRKVCHHSIGTRHIVCFIELRTR